MPLIIDDSNFTSLLGDGTSIIAGGERRLLSRVAPPQGYTGPYAKPFGSVIPVIPRNDWSARIKEQKARKMRVSDHQKFAPHDQNGLPTCWANGPAHAGTTQRVIQGLPLVYLSACSLAVPISGGHSGGYEGDAWDLIAARGAASQDVWSNNDTNRSLDSNAAVIESRKHHIGLQALQLNTFDEWATAALLTICGAVAYDWWSHVISSADLVEIEAGSYGLNQRNNWGDWGDKNDYGFPGYVTMREGKGTPSSGFIFIEIQASAA